MKAVCWMGKGKVETHEVSDPVLLNPHDAILRVTSTAICGSDLHLFDGFIPTMEEGDILGHEFMGIVEETGSEVTNLKRGDRVVVPFTIACGNCLFCKKNYGPPAITQTLTRISWSLSTDTRAQDCLDIHI